MEKIYDKITWHNNTTPALNEDNLNAMSEAIDGIDDRVIALGDDIFVALPQIAAYLAQADSLVQALETMSKNPPYIGDNGDWYVWDTDTGAYVDSEVDASITVDIADITMLSPGDTPYVTNTGTNTDPVFHLYIPRGDDGVSPAVTITTITGGHRVTITDADHPQGQSFDVMDGSGGGGSGDMQKSVYDSTDAVETAGGIVAYISANAMSRTGSNAGNVTFDGAFTVGTRKSGSQSGAYSSAHGYNNTASAGESFAAGTENSATAANSQAFGSYNTASASNAAAFGNGTKASRTNQLVCGKYNKDIDSTSLFEVGNGSADNSRSSAFAVFNDGTVSVDNGTTKLNLNTVASNAASAAGTFTSATSAAVGATSASFSDAAITSTSVIDVYCENTSGTPVPIKTISASTGSATITFDALTEATSFKLWVR